MSRRLTPGEAIARRTFLTEHTAPLASLDAITVLDTEVPSRRPTGVVTLAERYPDHRTGRARPAPRVPVTRRRRRNLGLAVAELLPAALVVLLALYAVGRILAGTAP